MNLLEKANIITTATAYDNGKLHSVKGGEVADFDVVRGSAATRVTAQGLVENVQILSSNLVQNGDFSEEGAEEVSNGSFSQEGVQLVTNGDFANWTNDNPDNWTLVNEDANNYVTQDGSFARVVSNDTSSIQIKQTIFTIGKTYKVDLDAVVNSGNVEGLKLNDATAAATIGYVNSTGHHTFYFKAEGTAFVINRKGGGNTDISIDNVSVREVGQDWVLTQATVGDGEATIISPDGSYAAIYQDNVATIGKTYKCSIDVLSISGTMQLRLGSGTDVDITTIGTKTFYINAASSTIELKRKSGAGTLDVTITNISVKEVGQNWIVGSDWSIAENKAVSSGSGNNLQQTINISSNKTYKLTFDVISTSGILACDLGGAAAKTLTDSGSKEYYFQSVNTNNLRFYGGNYYGEITNISVIEISSDTNLPRINYENFSYQDVLGTEQVVNGTFDTNLNNWVAYSNTLISWESGGYAFLDSNNSYWCKIKQSNVFEIGKTYKVILTAKSNRTDLNFHNSPINGSFSQADTFETFNQYYTATTTDFLFGYANAGSSTITIDNVSVKEYLGQSVVPNSGTASVLLEPQSTNLIEYSENFSGNWLVDDVTISSDLTISPSGESYSPIMVVNTVASRHNIKRAKAGVNTATLSIFAKARELSYIQIASANSTTQFANFDLSNGTIGSVGSSFSDAKIEDYGNGWYRCSAVSDNQYNQAIFSLVTSATSPWLQSWTSANNTDGLYIWGAQLEALPYATSYIPTSGAIATRLSDSVTGAGDATTFNSSEGVLYFEASRLSDVGTCQLGMFGSSPNEQLRIEFNNSSIRAQLYNGSYQVNISSTQVVTDMNKVAFKYKENDHALWINGVEVLTDNIGVTFNADELIKFNLSNGTGALPFFGKVKALAVFNEALTDSELECLTKI